MSFGTLLAGWWEWERRPLSAWLVHIFLTLLHLHRWTVDRKPITTSLFLYLQLNISVNYAVALLMRAIMMCHVSDYPVAAFCRNLHGYPFSICSHQWDMPWATSMEAWYVSSHFHVTIIVWVLASLYVSVVSMHITLNCLSKFMWRQIYFATRFINLILL